MESDDEMDRRSPIPMYVCSFPFSPKMVLNFYCKNCFFRSEKMELVNKGKCKTCGERGLTIGCSKCPKRYHLTCLIPPLRKAPTINWSCLSCRKISARKGNYLFRRVGIYFSLIIRPFIGRENEDKIMTVRYGHFGFRRTSHNALEDRLKIQKRHTSVEQFFVIYDTRSTSRVIR